MSVAKWESNRAWLFVLPVVLAVLANAVIPLMTVVNYSTQLVRGSRSVFKGLDNFTRAMGIQRVALDADLLVGLMAGMLAIGIAFGCLTWWSLCRRGWQTAHAALVGMAPVLLPLAVGMFLPTQVDDGGRFPDSAKAFAWGAILVAVVVPIAIAIIATLRRHGIKLAIVFAIFFPALLPFMLSWPFVHQLCYSFLVLAIELPLGVAIAKLLPRRGLASSLALVTIAVPLLIPFAVIGFSWRIFTDPGIGLMGNGLGELGWDYNPVSNWFDSWFTIILMDVWHWTSLVALLAFAGLRSIPPAWYQAALIDGASAWTTFWQVELPKLRSVLVIAVLLRFMDSFMVFTEPFLLNAGGPGSSTEMLSTRLYNISNADPTNGTAAAYSILYLLFVLFFSYVLYSVMMRMGQGDRETA